MYINTFPRRSASTSTMRNCQNLNLTETIYSKQKNDSFKPLFARRLHLTKIDNNWCDRQTQNNLHILIFKEAKGYGGGGLWLKR